MMKSVFVKIYVKLSKIYYLQKVKILKYYFPCKYADMLYKNKFGYSINWKHPRDLNEKILYLAFKTDTTQWSILADKYAVRSYVKSKGCENILVPLYAKWDKIEDVDISILPNDFVIKLNNGSGDAIIVEDKTKVSCEEIKQKLTTSLEKKFGLDTAERHYLKIKPCIIVEKLLKPTNFKLIDYKVWCFEGVPYCILTCSNRNMQMHKLDLALFDLKWNRIDENLTSLYRNDVFVPKPVNLEQMIEYAKILSEGIHQVRVDFYEIDGQIYFGEMTLTSATGKMDYFTPEYLVKMGNKIKI